MTSISWMYGRSAPLAASPLQLQSSAFATSSLASQADHDFAMDQGKAVPYLRREVKGTPMNGATFFAEDRSPLGVEVEQHRRTVKFTGYPEMSTPNVNSLSRSKYQLGTPPRTKQFDSVK